MAVDPSTQIRRATAEDLPSVLEIEHLCFQDPWPEPALAEELGPDPRRVPLLVEEKGRVLGVALVWAVADEMHVLSLGVRPEARRKGVASRLLDEIREEGRQRGCSLITLEVREHNEGALAFYLRHGFLEVARRRRYYPDTREDALVLVLPLGPRGEPSGPAR